MKALVTGANGFLGRHFTAELHRRGWQVGRCDTTLGWDALDTFRDGTTDFVQHFDLVIHAAAREPHRAAIDGKPAGHVYNQLLDAAMFDWAIRTGQGRVLYLSSSAAYPTQLQSATSRTYDGRRTVLREDSIFPDLRSGCRRSYLEPLRTTGPDAHYGWTKLTGEAMAKSARSAGLPVTIVRPFSGYGEDQAEDFPFGAFVARARRREDPFVLWNANAVRDWVHVDDVVNGALAVVESGTEEPVNLCTGVGTSCGDLAAMVTEVAGYRPEFAPQGDKPAGVAYRVGDPTRLHQYYKPQVSLEEGIARAVNR